MARTAVQQLLGRALEDEDDDSLLDDDDALERSPADADDDWEPIDAGSAAEAEIEDDTE